jgi:hypothetical protein
VTGPVGANATDRLDAVIARNDGESLASGRQALPPVDGMSQEETIPAAHHAADDAPVLCVGQGDQRRVYDADPARPGALKRRIPRGERQELETLIEALDDDIGLTFAQVFRLASLSPSDREQLEAIGRRINFAFRSLQLRVRDLMAMERKY